MNMSKVTRQPLDIKPVGKSGTHISDIPNLTEWLLDGKKKRYKTKELAECLISIGAVFSKSDIKSCITELNRYLPPKKSIGLSLEPYIKRLHALYLENFRRHQPKDLYDQATTTLDMNVLLQWVQNISRLKTLRKTSLRNLVLFHDDKKLILDARKQAYDQVTEEVEQGIEYDKSSLFANLESNQQDEPASIVNKQSNSELWLQVMELHGQSIETNIKQIKELQDELNQMHQLSELQTQTIEANYEEIKELKDELEQIKNLLNTRVQDLLRAVK